MAAENRKAILSKSVALALINKGFPVINIAPSQKFENNIVYMFDISDEFEKAFSEIMFQR